VPFDVIGLSCSDTGSPDNWKANFDELATPGISRRATPKTVALSRATSIHLNTQSAIIALLKSNRQIVPRATPLK
jgi:hypothetical protein